MERSRFARNLEQATAAAILAARGSVTDRLPEEARYWVRPEVEPCDAAGVVERLWQNGEVPVWIDVTVDGADDRFTSIRLHHTNRTSARDEALRCQAEGCPPFYWGQPLGPG